MRLLWQICQIPDFRKTLTDAHLHLLATVFKHLTGRRGVLPNDWVGNMIAKLERFDGDIDALVSRIAHVRTWTYMSHRASWLTDAAHWQERAREVEDRLSDALHERLTQRFVDRRTSALMRSLRDRDEHAAVVDATGEIAVDGHLVGRIEGLNLMIVEAGLDADRRLLRRRRRRTLPALRRRAGELAAAPDEAVTLGDDDSLRWQGAIVGRLRPGERAHPVCSWSWIRPSTPRPRTGSGAGWAAGSTAGSVSVSAPWPARARPRAGTASRAPAGASPTVWSSSTAPCGPRPTAQCATWPARPPGAGAAGGPVRPAPCLRAGSAQAGRERGAHAPLRIFHGRPQSLPPQSHGAAVALSGSGRGHAVSGVRCIRRLRRRVDILERIAAQVRAQARDSVSFSVPPTMAAEAGLTRAELATLVEAGLRPEAARRAWWLHAAGRAAAQ